METSKKPIFSNIAWLLTIQRDCIIIWMTQHSLDNFLESARECSGTSRIKLDNSHNNLRRWNLRLVWLSPWLHEKIYSYLSDLSWSYRQDSFVLVWPPKMSLTRLRWIFLLVRFNKKPVSVLLQCIFVLACTSLSVSCSHTYNLLQNCWDTSEWVRALTVKFTYKNDSFPLINVALPLKRHDELSILPNNIVWS